MGIIGILYFKQPISILKIISMLVIVAGVVGLHVSGIE
jgi:multidrug transporter EmrE-like cation transporter